MGKAWHDGLRAADANIVPHALSDAPTLDDLSADLPLRVRSFQNDKDLYLALLQVCCHTHRKRLRILFNAQ